MCLPNTYCGYAAQWQQVSVWVIAAASFGASRRPTQLRRLWCKILGSCWWAAQPRDGLFRRCQWRVRVDTYGWLPAIIVAGTKSWYQGKVNATASLPVLSCRGCLAQQQLTAMM